MSVFKQNPFLAGFGAAMVVCVGGLGYLAYSAMEENSKARKDYDEKRSELTNLQGSSIYPNDDNLKDVRARKQALQAKVNGLQKELAATKIKVEPILPAAFQDKLTATVVAVAKKAAEVNVKFPGNEKEKEAFFLGFEAYRSSQPKVEAAPALNRQLKAIEAALNLILDAKNVNVLELTRPEINEEKDLKPVTADPRNRGKKPEETSKSVIERQPFTLRFVATQENFQKILNGIVGYKQQIFVVRSISIYNQAQEPPAKVVAGAAPAPAPIPPTPPGPDIAPTPPVPNAVPAVAPADAPPAPAEKKEFIFGKEMVDVTMQIDIVDVAEPAAEKAAAKK